MSSRLPLLAIALLVVTSVATAADDKRPRLRDLGVTIGVFDPGPLNAITDVRGVRVGHRTLIEGERIRTGVTAIVPHEGNVFQDKTPAAVVVGNGFGKLMGTTQIMELGEIETPILLTNTLAVSQAAEGIVRWTLAQPGNEQVQSVNAVVGETNDGRLNDIRARTISYQHAIEAIEQASAGAVAEGAVGAGTGTIAFGLKGVELAVAGPLEAAWSRLDAFALFEEPFDLFLSRRHKFAGDTADRAQLAEETLLIDMRCEMAGALAHRLEALGLADMRRHQLASQSDVLSLVEANFGVAILPIGSAQTDAIRRVALPGLDLARTVSAYCVAGRHRGPAAATLLNMLRAAEWPSDRSQEWRPPYGAARA